MNTTELNRICKGTLIDLLDIVFTTISDNTIKATMQIQAKHHQPMGFVHGGALLALAETVGSAGSFLLVDSDLFHVFASAVNGQHLAPARNGTLFAIANLTVLTDFKHVWDVEIKDENGKLISISRVTNSVKPKNSEAPR